MIGFQPPGNPKNKGEGVGSAQWAVEPEWLNQLLRWPSAIQNWERHKTVPFCTGAHLSCTVSRWNSAPSLRSRYSMSPRRMWRTRKREPDNRNTLRKQRLSIQWVHCMHSLTSGPSCFIIIWTGSFYWAKYHINLSATENYVFLPRPVRFIQRTLASFKTDMLIWWWFVYQRTQAAKKPKICKNKPKQLGISRVIPSKPDVCVLWANPSVPFIQGVINTLDFKRR